MSCSSNSRDCRVALAGSLAILLLVGCGSRDDRGQGGERVAYQGAIQESSEASSDHTDRNSESVGTDTGQTPEASDLARRSAAGSREDADVDSSPLGQFALSYYWMASQEDQHKRSVQLYTRHCTPLAKVSRKFAQRLAREGTGQLHDGRTINVAGPCDCGHSPCYFELDAETPWGVGVGERPLSPFRSVAVDPETVPIGTVLYIAELDGLTVPGHPPWGGFVHDGCVIADDRGGAIEGKQIDLYMVAKAHYRAFDRRHRLKKITVFDGRGRCERDGNKIVPVNRNST